MILMSRDGQPWTALFPFIEHMCVCDCHSVHPHSFISATVSSIFFFLRTKPVSSLPCHWQSDKILMFRLQLLVSLFSRKRHWFWWEEQREKSSLYDVTFFFPFRVWTREERETGEFLVNRETIHIQDLSINHGCDLLSGHWMPKWKQIEMLEQHILLSWYYFFYSFYFFRASTQGSLFTFFLFSLSFVNQISSLSLNTLFSDWSCSTVVAVAGVSICVWFRILHHCDCVCNSRRGGTKSGPVNCVERKKNRWNLWRKKRAKIRRRDWSVDRGKERVKWIK